MKYVNPTVTDAGRNLLTQTNGNGTDCTEIDQAIFSNQRNTSNKSLAQFTVNDFNTNNASVIRLPTVSVKHQTDTIQPEVNLDNSKLSVQYPVYMIGVLAHAKSDPNNEILLAVEESNDDPLILPKATDINLNCTFALPVTLSDSDNINVIMTEAGMVTDKDFNEFQSAVSQSLGSQSSGISSNFADISANAQNIKNNSSNISILESSVASNSNNIASNAKSIATNSDNIANIQSNMTNNSAFSSLQSIVNNNSNNIKKNLININQLRYHAFNYKVNDLNNISDGKYIIPNLELEFDGILIKHAPNKFYNQNPDVSYDYIILNQVSSIDIDTDDPNTKVTLQIALLIGRKLPCITQYREGEDGGWTPWY